MRIRTPIYLSVGMALCMYMAVASRYGLSLFDNPVTRGLRASGNSLHHK